MHLKLLQTGQFKKLQKHSHKKRKESLEAQAVLLIFLLELEISGVAVQRMHGFFRELLSEYCGLVGYFSHFIFYDYGANAPGCRKRLLQTLLVCYSLLNSQNITINNSEKDWLLICQDTSVAPLLQKLHRKRSNNWPMGDFIHNGTEITTWMGYNFKTKSTKSKAKQHKNIFFES